jgi:hypothetical protein
MPLLLVETYQTPLRKIVGNLCKPPVPAKSHINGKSPGMPNWIVVVAPPLLRALRSYQVPLRNTAGSRLGVTAPAGAGSAMIAVVAVTRTATANRSGRLVMVPP